MLLATGLIPATNDFSIKAWINFNGTGTIAERDSYNVSGITDDGTGKYTITWDTDFANANYCVIATCGTNASRVITISSQAAGSVSVAIHVSTTATLADQEIICVMAIGAQ